MKPKVLLDDVWFVVFHFSSDCNEIYGEDFEVIRETDLVKNPEIKPHVEVAVARNLISRIDLDEFPKLKIVCKPCAGFDYLMPFFPEFKRRGIRVMHTPQSITIPATDMAWALLMSCARQIPKCE